MSTRFERFSLRMMISCFVAMIAFAPATLLAEDSEKKAEGQDSIIASPTSEEEKKDTMEDSEKEEDASDKKGGDNSMLD